MNKQQKLDFIRRKCCEANPALMELGFGCEIRNQWGTLGVIVGVQKYEGESDCYDIFFKNEEFARSPRHPAWAILGRLPSLADVLNAIQKKDPANKTKITLESDGQFLIYSPKDNGKLLGPTWNLLLPFDQQDEPCIDFLFELLK